MDWQFLAELAINGALTGLMYALCALGLVLIYKTSGVANLAQGALIMTGGYLVAWLTSALGVPLAAAIAIGLVSLFAMGFLIERLALRSMIGQPVIMIIMLTLGLEILFARAHTRPWRFGPSASRPWHSAAAFDHRRYFRQPHLSLRRSRCTWRHRPRRSVLNSRRGVILRAVSDDQPASWAVGIRVEGAIALSWGLAGLTALLAGVLWGSVQGVDWTLSLLLIKALAVAILGGLDSILGALVAGVFLGIAESVIPGYLDPIAGGGTRDVVASLAILLTTIARPYGLFGREQIERI